MIPIPFVAVNRTLHEGFSDETLGICCFTDHQIFDRFHKYSLKSDQARSGKIALSIKELNQLQPGDYVVHIDHGIGSLQDWCVCESEIKCRKSSN